MKIGIDLLGLDDNLKIIEYINKFNDKHIILYVYGFKETLDKIKDNDNIIKNICTEEVFISDDSARVHRKKKDSSMIRMLEDEKNKVIDISISGGSTGAYMASSLFILGRVDGVNKPSLATMLPTENNHKFLMTDLGANVEAKVEDIKNYAKMGALYVKYLYDIKEPKIALINIGAEENKGNKLYKDAHKLIKEEVDNFVGNIEAREILKHNNDVVVVDGFTGNVLLKSIEGVASSLGNLIKGMFLENFVTKISALLVKKGIKNFKKKFDYSEYGGAFLLGIKKPVIKIHGSADDNALHYAILQAKKIHEVKLYDIIREEFKEGEK